MNMFKKNGGFTLVELIVVIAILAILAGIAVPAYSGYMKSAQEAGDVTALSAVKTAAVAAMATTGEVNEITVVAENGTVSAIKFGPIKETVTSTEGGTTTTSVVDKYVYVVGTGDDAATTASKIIADYNTYISGGNPTTLKYFTTGAQWTGGDWTAYTAPAEDAGE